MIRLLVFLLFLIASVFIGIEIVKHPGYLLIVYHPWTIQMPVWFAFVAAIVVLALFYLLIYSIDHLQFLCYRIKNWFRFRHERKSYSKTQQGLAFLIESRYKKAEKFLLAGVTQSVEPLMNYLGAAKAAHELKAYERRDSYLQKAYQIAPGEELAIGLTQAELEIEQGEFSAAQDILNRLRTISPRHPRVLRLLEKVYVHEGNWNKLLSLLPAMRKAKVLTPDQLDQFEKNLYIELIPQAADRGLLELHQFWNGLPKRMRRHPEVALVYVNMLKRFPDTASEIEAIIRKVLKENYLPELVKVYGTLPFTNLNRQLVIVGAWVKLYGQRPELLLLLGKLCARIQLWGKAKDYLERCLALGPNAEASLEYGKLLEQLDQHDEALHRYRQGLEHCS